MTAMRPKSSMSTIFEDQNVSKDMLSVNKPDNMKVTKMSSMGSEDLDDFANYETRPQL